MTRREIPSWLPLVLVVLVLITLFHRLLSGQTLFWGLPSLQFYPWRHFAFQQLSEGRLPTWNPYVGAGAPLLANYQSAVFYPPNWLFFVLPDAQAINAVALLHVIWAGLGMWLFTDTLGLPPFGRGISTLSYALGGYLIARLGSFPTADAGAWIPWMFWGVHQVITRRHWRDVGWLSLFFGMQLLAGHAQTTWYSSLGVGLYALWIVLWQMRRDSGQRRIYVLLLLGMGVLLGLAAAAIQLIPTAEYLRESQRSGGLDYDIAANLSYSPFRLITLLSPNFYGTPADGTYLTQGIYFEDAAYIGFIPVISAMAAVVGWIRKRRFLIHYPIFAQVPFWLALALIALVFAMGRHGPVFGLLYDHVPTFDFFREPVRWLILTVFSLSVMAGIGTQHWGRGKWVVFWSRLAAAGGGAMVVMSFAARQIVQPSEELNVLTMGTIALGSWIACAALLTLTQPDSTSRISPLWWRIAVLVFVALDLAWAATGLNPSVPADFYRNFSVSRPEGRIYWFDEYEKEIKFERFFDLSDYRLARDQWPDVRASLLPNLNMLDGVPSLNNFDPLLPRYHGEYIDLIEEQGMDSAALLRAAGVSQVYGTTQPEGWQGEGPTFVAPETAPRAWVVPAASWADSDDLIKEMLRDPVWDPEHTVILSGTPPNASDDSATVRGEITLLENRPNRQRYRVETNAPGYLVISNTWYPGWSASINGGEVDLYRANLAFQAVKVPAGGAEVTVHYNVTNWGMSAGISIVASLVILVIIALGYLLTSRETMPEARL